MNRELSIALAELIRQIGNFVDKLCETLADDIQERAETTDEQPERPPTVRRRRA